MKNKRIGKVVGKLDKSIAYYWYLEEHENKNIIKPYYLLEHIEKHKEEFSSLQSFYITLNKIKEIIEMPDYVFYDKKKRGLEYYKKLVDNVCVIVRISKKRELIIVSIYPVSEEKIAGRMMKDIMLIEQIQY